MARSINILTGLTAVAFVANAAAAAETSSIVSLFLPLYDPQPLVASIIGGNSDATTYQFSCAPGTDSNNCGLTASATIVQGPTTVSSKLEATEDGYNAQEMICKLDYSADLATCTVDVTQSGTDITFHSSTVDSTAFKDLLKPVTVTAGFENVSSGGGGGGGGSAASTPSGASAQPTASGDGNGGSTGGSGSSQQSTSTSGNAAPAATQHAILAGMAAVVGAIAL